MKIKIEDNIPIPHGYGDNSYSGTVRKLKKGQSFAFHTEVIKNTLYQTALRGGFKITIRREGDHFRVWRLS